MAKASGLGMTVFSVDDSTGTVRAIINDINSFQFATPRGVQDVTGLDKSAYERILLLADMSLTINATWNPATGATMHDVFKTVPSTSVNRTTTITVGGKTLAAEILYTDYPLNRAQSGEFTAAIPGVLADGTVPTWA